MSTQLAFPFQIPVNRPLLPVEFVEIATDATYDDVLNLVELGRYRWTFNIALDPAGKQTELRIWRGSFIAHQSRETDATEIDDVLRDILPNRDVRSPELMLWLACGHKHITRLIDAGELEQIGQPAAAKGPNAFRRIKHESARRFLLNRSTT